jgi:hypothetical protein
MLTIEDCVAMSRLSEDEVAAIAAHEHLPDICAVELGAYLHHLPDGQERVRAIIRDDIAVALGRGDNRRVATLKLALAHFLQEDAGLPAERHRDQARAA